MANTPKPRPSKRVTPKGTVPGRSGKPPVPRQQTDPSGRYTPPIPRAQKVSPPWVPILMFALLGIGAVLIVVNYLGVLPGGADNKYLLVGLLLITCGFITATQYH